MVRIKEGGKWYIEYLIKMVDKWVRVRFEDKNTTGKDKP
jgi:hypothetical protein